MKNVLRSLVLAVCLAGATSTFATLLTFNVKWSGAALGNGATGSGYIVFDDAFLPEVGSQTTMLFPNAALPDLSITITGTTGGVGDGTWDETDFSSFFFATPTALDLSTELIGQLVGAACPFGTSTGPCGGGAAGDFNLFAGVAGAPTGTFFFQLTAAGGESLLVTSMAPAAVPEPFSLALLGLGLIGLGWSRRK